MELRDQLQQTLGESYTLERELGGGGMSRVFVAAERALDRKVVVKVVPPAVAGGVDIERFKREIQVAARLQHAHIVPLLTAGETNGLPYYTMPFVEGESLRARLVRSGALPITETISVLRDVARALAYAHEHGVMHRDIKPDNIMLSGGSAVVTDFGIAKAITVSRTESAAATLTQIGTSLGTPAYMAPEQAAADPAADHRVDLYAFGCVAYEMLAGQPPFVEKTPQRLLTAHMAKTPDPILMRRPDTPAALAELIMRCLNKDAASRPGSAAEIARFLETVTSGGGHAALPSILLANPGMLKRALLIHAGAFVAVAVLAKAAIVGIGLPDWVFPGSLIVMALGVPVILFTGYVQRITRAALTATPTYTPGGTPSMQGQGTLAAMAMRASPHVSWKRTTLGGVVAVAGFAALVSGFMGLRALGIGPAGSLLSSGKLTASDQILVADFKATGPDSALSGVLAEAMRSSLSKSRKIRVVQASAVSGALQRMERPISSRLDLTLAQELAQREGLKAIIAGELTAVSGGYLVGVKLISAASGDVLASFQESADGAKDLIPAMDQLGRQLRAKIGESLRDVQRAPPLARVATASLDALRKFTEGAHANDVGFDLPKAVSLLDEAISLDSNFAMAYRKLSIVLGNMGNAERAMQAIERAYALRDRVPEAERLALLGVYYQHGPHPDRAKEIESYEQLFARYPEWLTIITSNNLAAAYQSRREYARAESLWTKTIKEAPDEQAPYLWVVWPQVAQGNLAEAMRSIARARARKPALGRVGTFEAWVRYSEGRIDSAKAVLTRQATMANPYAREAQVQLGALALREGRINEWNRRQLQLNAAPGRPNQSVIENPDGAAIALRLLGQPGEARRRMDAFLRQWARPVNPRPERALMEARHNAYIGRAGRARALLAQFDAADVDSARRRVLAPLRHGALAWLAIAEDRYLDAIAEFREADRLQDGPLNGCAICADPGIGYAFDRANMPDSAIAAFEHFVNTPHLIRPFNDAMNLPWILRRLGELYEARGDGIKAAAYYRQFIDLWKNADAELQPQVTEVRDRLKRLADAERRKG